MLEPSLGFGVGIGVALTLALVLGVATSVRNWQRAGYRGAPLTPRRKKAELLAARMMDVEDEDDSEAEEYSEAAPNDSHPLAIGDASELKRVHGAAMLSQLPAELWLEVFRHCAPHTVAAVKATARPLHRHLDGVVFWSALCQQAFEPWMRGVSMSADAGATYGWQHRSWQRRYAMFCRDEPLLAARRTGAETVLILTPIRYCCFCIR